MRTRFFLIILFALPILAQAQDKPAYKFSGYMFDDYYYNVTRDANIATFLNVANGGAKDLNGFQLRRIYFTYDNEISPVFSTRFRLEATTGNPFVKDAYLKWKNVFQGSDLYFGLQGTPAFEISEGVWGYRSVEKTILDLRGIVSSRDLAVGLRGKLDESAMVKYWVMFGNNSSTGAEADKYKRLYGHIQFSPTEKITATLYADYKMQAGVNDPKSTTNPKATLGHNALTVAVFAGYTEKDKYRFGVEGFVQTTAHEYKDGSADSLVAKNTIGVTLFGTYNLTEALTVLGRFDLFDPNTNSKSKYDARNYVVFGLDWKADKNVSIIPNILYETYDKVQSGAGTRSVDASLTARITIYYIFL